VQAYAYGAYRGGAAIARSLGEEDCARALDGKADALRERFERAFWCERLGSYALALDGDKRPCEVLASNAGHALLTGIAHPDRARGVAARLLGKEGYSGWGVRTLGAGEARYNPMSYHDGSVWPHDNALIALGFGRYGLVDEALRLLTDLAQAAPHFDRVRLPELFCGFGRRGRSGPVAYPVACSPQAWAAAAPFALLEACLGVGFEPGAGVVRLVRPRLPGWLDGVEVRDLALGGGSVTLAVERSGAGAVVRVPERRGGARVVVEA